MYCIYVTFLAYSGNMVTRIISPLLAIKFGVWREVGFRERGMRRDDCIDYAFSRVLNEPWGSDPSLSKRLSSHLFNDTQFFLNQRGYNPIEKPRKDDLVVYGDMGITGPSITPEHFGVYRANDWVMSKFGAGPVFRHKVWAIPIQYGNTAVFFRKTNGQE